MKKIISIALSLIMMMCVCVPAFAAATTTDVTTDGGSANLNISTDASAADSESISVKIPADTAITWNDTNAVPLVYTVETHLKHGRHLEVTVTNDGTNTMKYTDALGAKHTIAYTLTGDNNFVASSPIVYDSVNDKGVDKTVNVTIAAKDWKSAVVGDYSDKLTFTANIV